MANILEFVRRALTEEAAQEAFRADPEEFVNESGFPDLTGEDVVEAVLLVRRTLPEPVAGALADFEDARRLPPVRPGFDERELDAAIRQLDHAIHLATAAAAGTGSGAGEPGEGAERGGAPVREPEPAATASTEAAPDAGGPAAGAAAGEEASVMQEAVTEIDVRDEPDGAAAREGSGTGGRRKRAGGRRKGDAAGERPSLGSFDAALEAAAAEARELLHRYAGDVLARLNAALDEAQQDADAIRAEAEADREAARRELEAARTEAARIRAEAEEVQGDLERRREQLRAVEQELKERLAGLDEVFRSVLDDH